MPEWSSGTAIPREVLVRDDVMDSNDWEYILGGILVGTKWHFPDFGEEDVVGSVTQGFERHDGERMDYPELELRDSGMRLSVSSFLRRIDPSDYGDIEPRDDVARRIVSIQEAASWRSTFVATEDWPNDG